MFAFFYFGKRRHHQLVFLGKRQSQSNIMIALLKKLQTLQATNACKKCLMTWRLLMVSFGSQRPTNFKMVMEYKPNITYISIAYNFIRLVDGCVLNILTSWMLCGSVVLLNENIWEIVKSWRGQLPKKLFWSILKSRVWLASVQIFNFSSHPSHVFRP